MLMPLSLYSMLIPILQEQAIPSKNEQYPARTTNTPRARTLKEARDRSRLFQKRVEWVSWSVGRPRRAVHTVAELAGVRQTYRRHRSNLHTAFRMSGYGYLPLSACSFAWLASFRRPPPSLNNLCAASFRDAMPGYPHFFLLIRWVLSCFACRIYQLYWFYLKSSDYRL